MASYFQQSSNLLPGGRLARARDRRALRKLYSDNKQALEAARLPSSSGHYGSDLSDRSSAKGLHDARTSASDLDDIELAQLRKDFQYQQDRLLAWGVGWSEISARKGTQQHHGSQSMQGAQSPEGAPYGDLKVDYDQDAVGDLVASVIEEIKKLLDQSGQLSHPGRFENASTFDMPSGGEKAGWNLDLDLTRQKSPPTFAGESPKLSRKDSVNYSEWKAHELVTGRALLEQLKSCIDLLYSLVDHKEDGDHAAFPSGDKGSSLSKMQQGQSTSRFAAEAAQQDLMQKVHSHPLYIDFPLLQPMHDPNIDGDFLDAGANLPPPSYDDAQQISNPQARSIYFYANEQAHVIVDLVSINPVNLPALLLLHEDSNKTSSPVQDLYALAQKLSGDGLLSWDGHLKVLGFTLAGSRQSFKFGLVYALPVPKDPTAIQTYQTLSSALLNASNSSHTHGHDDVSIPPLENKFRLAYNITLLATSYLAHGTTHGHIRSNNVLFLKEHENPRHLGNTTRNPYLLQPVQAFVGPAAESMTGAPASEAIYHHPDAEALGYGSLPAHDIYSVGLLLLEIGVWLPLRKFWKPKYDGDRHIFVDRLRRTYTPKLASKCGSRYMKIVQRCLGAPVELMNKPDITDAAEFLLEILRELSQCCALDEAGTPSPLDVEVIEALIDESKANMPAKIEAANNLKMKEVEKSLPPIPVEPESNFRSTRGGPSSKRRAAAGQPSLRKYPDMDIPQEKLNTWNTVLLPKLQKVLTRVLADSPESASANLMMIGPSPDKAVTTIVIQCSDTSRVHEELKVKLKGKLGIGRGWGLIVVKGDVRRSGGRRDVAIRNSNVPRHSKHDGIAKGGENVSQRDYQTRPCAGASIGAFRDGEHLPPATFGGTVLVDGTPFGMSVHHMLDDASERGSDDEDSEMDQGNEPAPLHTEEAIAPHRSSARADKSMMDFGGMGSHIGADMLPVADELDFSDDEVMADDFQLYDSDSESDTSTIRPDFSMFDDEGQEYWFMEDGDMPELDEDEYSEGSSSDESIQSEGDKPGFAIDFDAFDDDEVCVTQPALDDVDEDFFPSLEDRDDDHLSSHSLGTVHASSGIRRKEFNGMKHEIDWALIRVEEERCSFAGRRAKSGGRSRTNTMREDGVSITQVASVASLSNTYVATVGRTSGPAHGKISQAMGLVKFHGRTSFASSYTIDGGFGVPGDSGAWVWNEKTGELCGHVLAWADGLKVAFLGPMEVMFEDMKEKLGAQRIELVDAFLEREKNLLRDVKNMKIAESFGNPSAAGSARGINYGASVHTNTTNSYNANINNTNYNNANTEHYNHNHNALLDLDRNRNQGPAHLECAKELQSALKRMSLDSSASASNAGGAAGGGPRTRDNSGDTLLSRSSRGSSASSGYSRMDDPHNHTHTHAHNRAGKERFDLRLSGHAGHGQEVLSIPMARALS